MVRKLFWAGIVASCAVFSLQSEASAAGNGNASGAGKATVCHEGSLISVAVPAVAAHLAHGDTMDVCGGGDVGGGGTGGSTGGSGGAPPPPPEGGGGTGGSVGGGGTATGGSVGGGGTGTGGEVCAADGEACTGDADCCNGLCNGDGVCGLLLIGEGCDDAADPSQCESGNCDDGLCAAAVCFAHADAPDTTCSLDAPCCPWDVNGDGSLMLGGHCIDVGDGLHCGWDVDMFCYEPNQPCDPNGAMCCWGLACVNVDSTTGLGVCE